VQFVHPDFEYARAGGLSTIKGVGALREWMEPDAFAEQHLEPLDFTVQGEKVLVREHMTGKFAGSGIDVDAVVFLVFTLNDRGLVRQAQAFLPHEEAEAQMAVGLSE
jgi:hypothetical protein